MPLENRCIGRNDHPAQLSPNCFIYVIHKFDGYVIEMICFLIINVKCSIVVFLVRIYHLLAKSGIMFCNQYVVIHSYLLKVPPQVRKSVNLIFSLSPSLSPLSLSLSLQFPHIYLLKKSVIKQKLNDLTITIYRCNPMSFDALKFS